MSRSWLCTALKVRRSVRIASAAALAHSTKQLTSVWYVCRSAPRATAAALTRRVAAYCAHQSTAAASSS
eukprot:3729359-Pyramimonas_sp.AAC.2